MTLDDNGAKTLEDFVASMISLQAEGLPFSGQFGFNYDPKRGMQLTGRVDVSNTGKPVVFTDDRYPIFIGEYLLKTDGKRRAIVPNQWIEYFKDDKEYVALHYRQQKTAVVMPRKYFMENKEAIFQRFGECSSVVNINIQSGKHPRFGLNELFPSRYTGSILLRGSGENYFVVNYGNSINKVLGTEKCGFLPES